MNPSCLFNVTPENQFFNSDVISPSPNEKAAYFLAFHFEYFSEMILRSLRSALLLIAASCGLISRADAQNTIHVPEDAASVQQAIDKAIPGDIVLISPGTYYENINFEGKAITVEGSGARNSVVLDGKGRGPVVTFNSGEGRNSILENLTVQDGAPINALGDDPGAGGVLFSPLLRRLTI